MLPVRTKIVLVLSFVTLLFFVLGTAASFAAEPEQAKNEKKSEKKKDTGMSATKVGKDPEKTLRKLTPAEEKVLDKKLKQRMKDFPRAKVEKRSDGTKLLRVAPNKLNFSMVSVANDGKLVHTCVQNGRQVTHKVEDHSTSKPQPLPEEKR